MKSEKQAFALPEPSPFSCDLVVESQKHIRFLKGLYDQGVTLKPPSSKSLDRYLYFWLPLVANAATTEDAKLIPPADVAWLWHCHRLAPMEYECYVQERYRKLLEASPCFVFQDQEDKTADAWRTRNLWKTLYPSEPFFLKENGHPQSFPETDDSPGRCLNGFDLVASAERQSTFLWQVSDFHFQEQDFLQDGVQRYYQFLKLPQHKQQDHQPLIPTFQIDLMWHTHVLESIQKYNEDCVKIRGDKLHHDDSLHDRTPNNKLDQAFQQTVKLWKEAYGCDYVIPTGTYRDELPSAFYDRRVRSRGSTTNNSNLARMGTFSYDQDDENLSVTLDASTFSTGTRTEADNRLPWLDPKDKNAQRDGKPAFIPAGPERHGGVSYQKKEGYVFGKGEAGLGYYSFDTRNAYKILYQRIRRKEYQELEEYNSVQCRKSLCGICRPSDVKIREVEEMLEEVSRLGAMAEYVKARYDSAGPTAELPRDIVEKHGARANLHTNGAPGSVIPVDIYAGGFDIQAFCDAVEDVNPGKAYEKVDSEDPALKDVEEHEENPEVIVDVMGDGVEVMSTGTRQSLRESR